MKKLIVLLKLSLICFIANAQTETVTEEWVQRYNGPDSLYDVAIDVDVYKNVYVTGASYQQGSCNIVTIKYNKNGDELWICSFNGTENLYDGPSGLVVNKTTGDIYITGASYSVTHSDIVTIKYDTDGNLQWINRYNGPANTYDAPYGITIDSTGNVYITGASTGIGTGEDMITIKYNSAGVQQWIARNTDNSWDKSQDIVVDNSGNVYITGLTGSGFTTIKYDANGNQVWRQDYKGTAEIYDIGNSLVLDYNNNIYVTGTCTESGTGTDYTTIKYSKTGVQQWIKQYNGTGNGNDGAKNITIDPNGYIIVTGQSNDDITTIKYDYDGNEQWVQSYSGTVAGPDRVNAIIADGDGNIYITGGAVTDTIEEMQMWWISVYDYVTIKYNTDGTQEWVQTYNGPKEKGNDISNSIALDQEGNVYVTGYSQGIGTYSDFATIKYKKIKITNPDNPFDFIGKLHRDVLIYLDSLEICCPDSSLLELNELIPEFVCIQKKEFKKKIKKAKNSIDGKKDEKQCGLPQKYIEYLNNIFYLANNIDTIGIESFFSSMIFIEKLILNDTILTKQQKSTLLGASSIARYDITTNNSVYAGYMCCSLCWLVHDALDIHYLDWMCCLGGCGWLFQAWTEFTDYVD